MENIPAALSQLRNNQMQHAYTQALERKLKKITPAQLWRNYHENRFSGSIDGDPIKTREQEIEMLKVLKSREHHIFDFAPATVWGTSTVLAPISQQNVLSAVRGTEFISDITNVMALEVVSRRRIHQIKDNLKIASIHRLVRGQQFNVPAWTPHFKVLALVHAGRDIGNFGFEIPAIALQIKSYVAILEHTFHLKTNQLEALINLPITDEIQYRRLAHQLHEVVESVPLRISNDMPKNSYYPSITFGMQLRLRGQVYDLIDGGMVTWTQKILNDSKERLLISGLGIEYLNRLLGNLSNA